MLYQKISKEAQFNSHIFLPQEDEAVIISQVSRIN